MTRLFGERDLDGQAADDVASVAVELVDLDLEVPPPVGVRRQPGLDERVEDLQRPLLSHAVHDDDRLANLSGHV